VSRPVDASLVACLRDVHPELAAEHGRPPTLAEVMELIGEERTAPTVRYNLGRLGLPLTDGRAVRRTGAA